MDDHKVDLQDSSLSPIGLIASSNIDLVEPDVVPRSESLRPERSPAIGDDARTSLPNDSER